MVGGYYATRWVGAGHSVEFTHVRDRSKIEALVRRLGPSASWSESLATAPRPDVAVLAVRWQTLETALDQLGPLSGVVVIDAVNPFNAERTGLEDLGGRTAADTVAEQLARRGGGRHVKALHSEGVERIAGSPRTLSLFVAGNDDDANQVAMDLIRDAGLDPIATGPLATARWSEPPGPLFGQGLAHADALAALARLQ